MTKDEEKSEASKNEGTETVEILTSEKTSDEDAKEKKLAVISKHDESQNAVTTILSRISRIDHSQFKDPTESDESEVLKQGIPHEPRLVQLDNAHLGIEERNANKFRELNSYDLYSNVQEVRDPGMDERLFRKSDGDGLLGNSDADEGSKRLSDGVVALLQEKEMKVPVGDTQEGDSTRSSNKKPNIEYFYEQEKTTKDNKGNKYNYDTDAMQQLLFNPMLKDIFKYNPAFDYLSKMASHENKAPASNAGSKFNYNSINGENQNGQEPVIKRKIQYHQMVFQPNPYMNSFPMRQQQADFPHSSMNNYYPGSEYGSINNGNRYQDSGFGSLPHRNTPMMGNFYPHHQQGMENNALRYPQMFNQMSHPYNMYQMRNAPPQRAYDEYFPVIIHNPFNMMWSAFTNIIEYGPEADVCKAGAKNMRKGRDVLAPDAAADEENIDINSELRFEIPKRFGGPPPFIRRMKVRRGGVAIAGPGGIATAGSGGTAIVGPGGTAYTKEDGTAIVGPGGRLVHVPEFPPLNFFKQPIGEGRTFQDPPGSKLIAMGPVIYYSPRRSS